MGYRRRRNFKKRNASSKLSILTKKPSATIQKRQIFSLAKKVNHLTRAVNANRALSTQTIHFELPVTGTVASPWCTHPLNNIQGLTEIFLAANQGGAKYKGISFKLDFNIVPDTEVKQDITMTAFIVSPANSKVVEECYAITPTGFPLTQLTANTDYVCEEGLAYMNKKRWHIHKVWHHLQTRPFSTQLSTTPNVSSQGDWSQVNIRKYYSCKNPININNRTGTWNQVLDSQMTPNNRLELIVFSDNTGATAPMLTANIIMTAYTSE